MAAYVRRQHVIAQNRGREMYAVTAKTHYLLCFPQTLRTWTPAGRQHHWFFFLAGFLSSSNADVFDCRRSRRPGLTSAGFSNRIPAAQVRGPYTLLIARRLLSAASFSCAPSERALQLALVGFSPRFSRAYLNSCIAISRRHVVRVQMRLARGTFTGGEQV